MGLGTGVTGIRFPAWLDSGSISDPEFELWSVAAPPADADEAKPQGL